MLVRGRNGRRVDWISVSVGAVFTIHCFVWGHVDTMRVASVRIWCHFRERAEPIGLAEVGDVFQGSFELPDFPFSLPIHLVRVGRNHNVFDLHGPKCLFQELGGESWVSITDNRGRYSMRSKNMVPE